MNCFSSIGFYPVERREGLGKFYRQAKTGGRGNGTQGGKVPQLGF
jgi:hypothetical protein